MEFSFNNFNNRINGILLLDGENVIMEEIIGPQAGVPAILNI